MERAKASRQPGEDDGDESRASRLSLAPQSILTPLSVVCRKPMHWLWPGRVPFGKLTVLDGDPGTGKSTISLDIAARLSRGLPMPGEDASTTGPRDVILVSVEDDAADTIKPRLDAAGADTDRIHSLTIRAGDAEYPPDLEGYLPHIEKAITEKHAGMLILDPISALLGPDVDMHKDQDVRSVLAPLKVVAERTDCAAFLIRHFNKNSGATALHKGGGSIAIAGAARSVLAAGKNPADESKRVLAVSKSNGAEVLDVGSLSYEIIPVTLPSSGGSAEVQTTKIEWLGRSEYTANDLVAVIPSNPEERSERQEAQAKIKELLSDGPMLTKELEKEAQAAGISRRTLERVRRDLRIKGGRKTRGQGPFYLWLPGCPPAWVSSPGTFGGVGGVDERDD